MGRLGAALCRPVRQRATVLAVNDAVPNDAPADDGREPAPAGAPASPEAALDWRQLVAQRRFVAARNAYLVTGEQDPDVRAALNALIDVFDLVRERAFGRALERIERLEERAAFVPWAELEEDLGVLRESAAALDVRDPDRARGLLLALEGTWFEAETLTQLGTTYVYDSDLEEAARLFERAIELDPQHYRALTNLGNVALEQDRVDDAIELYHRALKIDEEFPNAHHNLGVAYRKKGQLAKSVRSLRRAQRTQHRQEVAEARESIGKWAGPNVAKYFRWIVYALIAVGAYVLLRMAGYL